MIKIFSKQIHTIAVISFIMYINVGIGKIANTKNWMYLDNIKSYFIAEKFDVTAEYNGAASTEVPYENAVINLTFDQNMAADTSKEIQVTDNAGNQMLADFTTTDGKTFTATVASLSPNTDYTVDLSGVKTALGAGGNIAQVTFKTKKLPFAIQSVDYTESGSDVSLTVNVKNENKIEKTYVLLVGLFDGTKLLGADAEFITSAAAEERTFRIPKPTGEYRVEVLMVDGIETLNLLDKEVIDGE